MVKSNVDHTGLLDSFSSAARSHLNNRRGLSNTGLVRFELTMCAGAVLRLTKAAGVREVQVRHGVVWLTGTPASGDVLLQPGESFLCADNWPFVLQALRDTALVLKR